MKIRMLVGLALGLVASSAAASVVTPGNDFHAVDGDKANLATTVFGVQYQGTTNVTAVGGLKRQPAVAADGSQSVSIQFYRPTTAFMNGVIWSSDMNFMYMKSFQTNATDGNAVTKTVTFPASQLTNTSYLSAVVYMNPNTSVYGATVN